MTIKKDLQFFLFFIVILALLTNNSILSWNDASRMATIESLVDHHSFVIDNSRFFTGDKYFYQGHFYSDKPPILALYGSIFYFLLKSIGITFNNNSGLTCYLLVLLIVGVSTCIGLVYFYKTLKFIEVDDKWINVLMVVTATGTLLLPFSTVLNNHTVSGALLIVAFYYLLRIKESLKYAFISGLLIALAGSIDITVFLFIPFSIIVLFDKPLKSKIAFISACIPVLFIYFLLNLYISGSLTPPAMNKALWDYPGSIFNQNNLTGVSSQSNIFVVVKYAFNMVIGNRGLISHTPLLVFSIFGFAKVLFRQEFKYRQEYLFILLASLAYILMYVFRSTTYSGASFGIRWYAELMFLLCLPLAHIDEEIKNSRRFSSWFIVIAFSSIIISFIGVINPYVEAYTKAFSFINCLIDATKSPISSKLRLILVTMPLMCCILFIMFKFLQVVKKNPELSRSYNNSNNNNID
jgi:hypothetical protein